jgi:DNA topoisomerase-1
VQHGKTYASLESGDDVLTVGANRAVTLIAEKLAKGPRARRFGADPGRALGDHPNGGAVVVKNGRYGPYVSHDGVNATLPPDKTPDTVTLEEALALLEARAAKMNGAPTRSSRRKTARKAPAATATDVGAEPKAAPKRAARPARPKVGVKSAKKAKPEAPKRKAGSAGQ